VQKYWSIFKTQLYNRLAYPGDLATGSLTIVLFMFIFVQLWRTVYRASSGDGEQGSSIAGLSLSQVLWYIMLAETIILSTPRLSRGIAAAVKDGSIAYLLNKPYNFLLYQVSIGLGDSLVHTLFNLLAGGALVWLLAGPPPSTLGLPLVLVAMAFSWLLSFTISALIGLSAFVAEEVSSFEWIYQKLLMILGGLLIPLDFYPAWLQAIAQALPFSYTIYGPARLVVEPSLERFARLVSGQLLWLALLGMLVAFVYRKSVTWLSINGG
jgi:ABC-2 type transport system permease protein